MVVEGQDAAARRDLQIHRRPLPVLQEGHATMAELLEAQFVLQRLLHQGLSPPGARYERAYDSTLGAARTPIE